LIAVTGFAACGSSVPDSVVVRVGQTAITETTVDHWMSAMAGGRIVRDPSKQDQTLRQQALAFLISSQWLIGEATNQGLKVSKQEIEQRFKEKKNTSFPGGEAEFHEFLKTTGQTVSDVMLEVKAELASSKIRQKVASREPKITQVQIAEYYTRNKQRYVRPERRELAITNRKSRAGIDQLIREIESGKSLASVTQLESVQRQATSGDKDKSNALEKAIFSAKPNVLDSAKLRVDYYLFKVKQITASSEQPLAQVQSSIRKQLTAEQQQRTLAEFIKAWRKKWTAITDCHTGYVVPGCRQYKGPIVPEAGL
jgi:foldase protein PrsA